MGRHWLLPNDRTTFAARAGKIAEGCVRETDERTTYWYSSSRELVQAVIMAQAELGGKEANLGRVARIISGDVFGYARWVLKRTRNPFIRATLARYASPKAADIRSLNEVIENTRTELSFLLEETIAETLADSDVTFSQCKRKTTSIYVILPAENVDGRFQKLLFCSANGELLRNDAKGKRRTLIMADEYYSMGFKDGDKLFATARKFNTQLWICLQCMAQLRTLHPRNSEVFINNAGLLQILDAGDLDGSEMVSRLAGDSEVYGYSKSVNEDFDKGGIHISDSMGQHGRRLILPHEVRQLGPREQILFVEGVKEPIRAARKPYFETGLKRHARRNPYYQKGGFWGKIFR
jgi:type IV secretory pathway TraG/TraD family ATPase VirD4